MAKHKITHQPRFDFRDAAFEALAQFPQLRGRTIFLLDQQNPAGCCALKAYGEPATIAAHMGNKAWQSNVYAYLTYMRTHKTSVACFSRDIPFQAVIFTPRSVLSPVHPDRAAMLFFEFDHELGHLLTRFGRNITAAGTTTLAENSAEAFATLRAIQRFGRATPHLEALSCWRARCLVGHQAKTHITTPVIDAIISDSARVDFTRLSADETIAAANDYTRRYCPKGAEVDFAVAQMRGAKDFASDGAHQQRLAAIVQATNNTFMFTVGARALVPVLASDVKPALPKDLRNSLILKIQRRAQKLGLDDTLSLLVASSGLAPAPKKKPGSKTTGLVSSQRRVYAA